VTVGLTAEATDKKNVEIVSDAYGLRSNIENERQAFKSTGLWQETEVR